MPATPSTSDDVEHRVFGKPTGPASADCGIVMSDRPAAWQDQAKWRTGKMTRPDRAGRSHDLGRLGRTGCAGHAGDAAASTAHVCHYQRQMTQMERT